MSEDETFVFVVCLIAGIILWARWYWQLLTTARLSSAFQDRKQLMITPIVAAALLFFILKKFSSYDVRDDPVYLTFYFVMGAAWLGAWRGLLSLLGISARDDVIERKNRSAAFAISGALLGIDLCFAGGNIGDGPGWWVVVFAGGLSSGSLFLLWFLLNRFSRLADVVTIERDVAAGIRLGGFFIGSGLILGRAVAGNWISAEATLADFAKLGWPSLLLLVIVVIRERSIRPKTDRGFDEIVTIGLAPAIVWVIFGGIVVGIAGWWT